MGGCVRRLPIILITLILTSPVLAGEPQWVEVRSPNFSVVTDAGEKRGREVAMRFEQMRSVFGSLMTKAKVNLPTPLQIVAFRNSKEMQQVAPLFNGKPTAPAGLFLDSGVRCFILLDMSVDNPWRVVFHEYAHQLLNGNMEGALAPWFEEGFAEYFSSIEVDGKQAHVGRVPDYDYAILGQGRMMGVADLMRVREDSGTYRENGDRQNVFYAECAVLAHYIFDHQLMPKVAAYFDLRENKHLDVEEAIHQAFGMKAAEFDATFRAYLARRHSRSYSIAHPPGLSNLSYQAQPMSAADAKAVVADIHQHSQDRHQQALAEFQDIVKSDPHSAGGCRGLGYAYLQQENLAQAREYLRRAEELKTDDFWVHYYMGLLMAHEGGSEHKVDADAMIAELEAAIRLNPEFADSYTLLAQARSSAGDQPGAIAAQRKALSISPRNQSYWYNLASLYVVDQQPDEAIAILHSLQIADNPELAQHSESLMRLALATKKMLNTEPVHTSGQN